MLGFIKKDFAMIRSNLKFLGIIVIVFIGFDLFGDMDISFIASFLGVSCMMSTFSYDDFNNWNAYAVTLPNGRKNSVRSKYVMTILLFLILTAIFLPISFGISYYQTKSLNLVQNSAVTLGAFMGISLVLSIMYPIIYKFGIENARIAILVLIFGTVFLGGFALKFIDLSNIPSLPKFLDNYLLLILSFLSILILYISYKISLKIYCKKEF